MRSANQPGCRKKIARFLFWSGFACSISAGSAFAQSAYNPYEMNASQFRNFSRPGGSNMFESMSGDRSQSSTFQQEMDKLFGGRETSAGLSRDKQRYYNAFRKYDEEFDRLYRPNQDVDRAYNERRSSRESVYFKAFREKDPRKRAELMKSFEKREDLAAVKDDMKLDESKAAERRRTSRPSDRSGLLGPGLDRSRSAIPGASRSSGLFAPERAAGEASATGPRASRGILGSRDDFDDEPRSRSSSTDKKDSLTERGRRFSEKIRPTLPDGTRSSGRPGP